MFQMRLSTHDVKSPRHRLNLYGSEGWKCSASQWLQCPWCSVFTSRLQTTWTTSNSGGRPGWWCQSHLQLCQWGQLTAIKWRRIQQLKLIIHQSTSSEVFWFAVDWPQHYCLYQSIIGHDIDVSKQYRLPPPNNVITVYFLSTFWKNL